MHVRNNIHTHLTLHDPAVKQEEFTYEFRHKLVEEQLNRKKITLRKLEDKLDELNREYAVAVDQPNVQVTRISVVGCSDTETCLRSASAPRPPAHAQYVLGDC